MFSVVQRSAVPDDSPTPDTPEALPRAVSATAVPAPERRRAVIGAESGRPEPLLPISRVFFQDGRGAGVSRLPPREGAARAAQLPATTRESAKIVLLPDRKPRPERVREPPPPRRRFSSALGPASAILVVLLYPAVVGQGDPAGFTGPESAAAPPEALSARPVVEAEAGSVTPGSREVGDVEEPAVVEEPAALEIGVEEAAMFDPPASPEVAGQPATMTDPPLLPEIAGQGAAISGPPASPEPDDGEGAAMADQPALPAPAEGEEIATVSQPLFSSDPGAAEATPGSPAPTDPLDTAPSGREPPAGPETMPQPVYDPPAAMPQSAEAGSAGPSGSQTQARVETGSSDDPQIASIGRDPENANQALASSTSDGSDQPVVVPELDRKRWREVQQRLSLAGFNPGSADGMPGPRTQEAIGAWQREHGLPADGILYADQLALLENETESAYRTLLKSARARAAAASKPERSSAPPVNRSTGTGRYIDQDGCLREPDGRAVPYYMPGCV
jgi:peptidoglycan hydrolase-like protein with peptidoglycan-binding domain